jgi:Ca2+-binding EF-hand superfamily protein
VIPRSIALSEQQIAQIREIFELFDTDGGGTIDRHELSVAMYALGFKDVIARGIGQKHEWAGQAGLSKRGTESITLEEFTSLMKGEINGRDPLEDIRAIFVVLQTAHSQPDQHPGLVTLSKLQGACNKFELQLTEEELMLMIDSAQIDVNRNGGVNEEEFLSVMRWSIWF